MLALSPVRPPQMIAPKVLISASLVFCCSLADAEVYRCVRDGRTTFQDRACPVDAEGDRVDVRVAPVDEQAAVQASEPSAPMPSPQAPPATVVLELPQKALPQRPDDDELRAARIRNQVLLGMTGEDVLRSAGKFQDYLSSVGADENGPYEVWTFPHRYEGFPYTVVLRRGVVTQFSDSALPRLDYGP